MRRIQNVSVCACVYVFLVHSSLRPGPTLLKAIDSRDVPNDLDHLRPSGLEAGGGVPGVGVGDQRFDRCGTSRGSAGFVRFPESVG